MERIKLFLQQNKGVAGTLLFAAFMLIQFVSLRLANQAGSGYLATEHQELVYLFIQVLVMAGIFLHALFYRLIRRQTGYGGVIATVLSCCAVGVGIMLFTDTGSLLYLVITGITVLCLGFIISAVYLKLSEIIFDGAKAGACVGIGYAAAVALQYVFQLQWTVKLVLAVLLIAAFGVSVLIFLGKGTAGNPPTEQKSQTAPCLKLIFSVMITLATFVFTHYYNSYIHHLQVESGYTDYNVYSWPRLLMIPAILLFGLIGDIKNGKFIPITTLCVVAISLVNTSVLGRDTYLLNMCLYYISLSAVVAYYHLTFLRLAPHTKYPELWAAMGRLLDSAFVILSFVLQYSQRSLLSVLIVDIAALAAMVVLMAVNGDFNFGKPPEPVRIIETVSVPVPAVDPFPVIQEEFGISPGEMKVLRELALTADKQDVIAERLDISISTLKHHVTSIYKKTDVKSRAALCQLVESKRKT